MERADDSIQFAAVQFFFEEVHDTRVYREVLPRFMSAKDYAQYTGKSAPGKASKS